MKKKRLIVNLISNAISFIIQMGISFIITPIIVEKVGNAAYGFVGLANNFVSYATIITVVINSMASRFITIEFVKGNHDEANKYYSSVFLVNAILSSIICMITLIFIFNINTILNVPLELSSDVKITFLLSFINLILSLFNTIFNISSFIENRIDLAAYRTIFGNIIKTITLVICFSLFPAKIYFLPLCTVLMTIYLIISNYKLSKKLCPELNIKIKLFDFGCVKKLTKSGIWNSINSLGKTLLTGVDLLIANIFVGAVEMGTLSIAKTIPTAVEGLLATFSNTFNPQFVILYSQNKMDELLESTNYSLKIIGLIMLVPLAGIIVFGMDFFHLWLPSKNYNELLQIQILSILSLLPFVISASNYTLFVLDSVTNKLKRPVIATFIMSIVSIVTTIIVLKFTNYGIFAIAGVSSIYWIIKVFFFNTINAAINLELKWYTFYKPFLKNLSCFSIILVIFIIIKKFILINSWIQLIVFALIFGIIGYIISFFILLDCKEKIKLIQKIFGNKMYIRERR